MSRTPQLQSERLSLDPIAVADAPVMVAVLADEELHEFTGGEPRDLENMTATFERLVAGCPRPEEVWHNWILRKDGDAIGFVQATIIEKTAILGWTIGLKWQRNGYASEGAEVVARWLRTSQNLTIHAHIHTEHVASHKVASHIGLGATNQIEDGEIVWSDSGRPRPTSE